MIKNILIFPIVFIVLFLVGLGEGILGIFYKLKEMYICVCNNLKESDIKSYVSLGCKNSKDIFREINSHVQCGKCIKSIKKIVNENRK